MAELELKRIGPEEAVAFRQLRFEGFIMNPESFSASLEDEQDRDLSFFEEILVRDYVIGAFLNRNLVGSINVSRLPGLKKRHVGMIGTLYVTPTARGLGVARRLIQVAIDHIRPDVRTIQLKVESTNSAAIHLYETFGFTVWATEAGSLMINGELRDAKLMTRDF